MSALFLARYGGECASCECDIEPDDEIGFVEGVERPVCQDCWSIAHTEPSHGPLCPNCFTEHVGECL